MSGTDRDPSITMFGTTHTGPMTRFLDAVTAYSFALGFAGGLGMFGFAVYTWLRTGTWTPVTGLDLVAMVSPSVAWPWEPSRWVGLSRAIESFLSWPIYFLLPLALWPVTAFFGYWTGKYSESRFPPQPVDNEY